MKNFKTLFTFMMIIAISALSFTSELFAQGEVTRSGSTWTARVNGSTVYTGSRMFDAVTAACNNMGSGTINIRNSGDSGPDGGNVYAIRPRAGQTLDFHGNTVNCNGGDLIVAIHADRQNNITVRNLNVTGRPRYAIWFRGCSGVTLHNITMNLQHPGAVGLGIRVDHSTGSASNLTISGNININGSRGHAIETYGINGINIGNVTVNNSGGSGLILNQSSNATVGTVTGNYNNRGGGYATFRVANNNGPNIRVQKVYSRNSGRGFFSVSGSRDCIVNEVDIANNTSHGVFLEDATDTHVNCGTVTNCNPNVQLVRTTRSSVNLGSCGGGGGTPPPSGSYVRIANRGTGLFIDGMGRTSNGSDLGQWASTTHVNAQWTLESSGGYVRIRNRATGLYIDGMGRTSNGDAVGQWANTTHNNAQWEQISVGSGYYQFRNRGTGLYLDGMGRTSNGDAVGQWANTTHYNSHWSLSSISSAEIGETFTAEAIAKKVSVYPNPVTDGRLKVELYGLDDASSIRIFDMSGKLVQEQQVNGVREIEMRIDAKAGLYILQVIAKDETITSKISVY